MDKLIDLHSHTNYSDGEYSPKELIKMAIERNVGVLAITDHDTLEGIKTVNREETYIKESGIKIVNGIELSAKVKIGQMHIVGLGIDVNNKELNDKTYELKSKSLHAVLSIMEQIKKDYGIVFSYEDIRKLVNANHNLGRPDIAKLCIKYGYAETFQEAFNKYLIPAREKIGTSYKGIPYEECLSLITNAGGIPVLAHPKTLKLDEKDFLILLKDMIREGLKAIEVYHSSFTKEEMGYYKEIALRYGLFMSGGSDYHGPIVKPDIELGTGKNGNIAIRKLDILNHIKY